MKLKNLETYLIDYLIKERQLDFSFNDYSFELYRSLVNTREPIPISEEYLKKEDEYLKGILSQKEIVDVQDFPLGISLYQGDITTIKADAIVNAANHQMLGCFVPGHHCIDNTIHTYAGMRLRLACYELMKKQKYPEPTGCAKITKAYNLPSQYIIHTVGPIVHGKLENKHKELLKMCYLRCLKKAEEYHLKSIVFCCISTGVFGFPKKEAAKIAVETVKDYLKDSSIKKVIFNVFEDNDKEIYHELCQ